MARRGRSSPRWRRCVLRLRSSPSAAAATTADGAAAGAAASSSAASLKEGAAAPPAEDLERTLALRILEAARAWEGHGPPAAAPTPAAPAAPAAGGDAAPRRKTRSTRPGGGGGGGQRRRGAAVRVGGAGGGADEEEPSKCAPCARCSSRRPPRSKGPRTATHLPAARRRGRSGSRWRRRTWWAARCRARRRAPRGRASTSAACTCGAR